jgi:hypothetical protein
MAIWDREPGQERVWVAATPWRSHRHRQRERCSARGAPAGADSAQPACSPPPRLARPPVAAACRHHRDPGRRPGIDLGSPLSSEASHSEERHSALAVAQDFTGSTDLMLEAVQRLEDTSFRPDHHERRAPVHASESSTVARVPREGRPARSFCAARPTAAADVGLKRSARLAHRVRIRAPMLLAA